MRNKDTPVIPLMRKGMQMIGKNSSFFFSFAFQVGSKVSLMEI